MISYIKRFLHWEGGNQPEISLSGELYEQLKPLRLPLILLHTGVLLGTLGYLAVTDYDLMQAFFQNAYTFTTTGFGALEESKFDALAIIYTAVVMFAGSAVMTFCTVSFIDILNRGKLISLFKEQRMIYKIARLKNHFVICHNNEYTIELAMQFRQRNIPFVVVDSEPNLEDIAQKYKYPYFIQEDPNTKIAMLKCHLSSAKGVITLSKNATDNIAQIVTVRLYEKELGRRPYYILASAHNNEEEDKLKKLGANRVLSPTKLLAQRINAITTRPDMENLLERFAYQNDTAIDLEEILVPRYSWLVLKKLKEAHMRETTKVFVVGIAQKEGKFIPMPDGDTLVTSESKLLVIGTSSSIRATKRIINKKDKPQELKYV